MMSKSTLDRQVETSLRDHDVRYTKGRRAVVNTLANAPGPMSAAEIIDVIGDAVPLSSLYRSLSVLEATGVVTHHLGERGLTRFELDEWLTGHHHHLVCVDCGRVSDVEIPPGQEENVRTLVAEIAGLASFSPSNHSLEIEGICSECS